MSDFTVQELTLGQLLENTAARFPDTDAVIHADRELRQTWSEFSACVDDMARGLMAIGVQKGEKVAVWATNVPHWVTLMFATARIGAILVTVNTNYRETELRYLLQQSECENLFIIDSVRDHDFIASTYEVLPELRRQRRGMLEVEGLPHLKRVFFLGTDKHRGMYSLPELFSLAGDVSDEEYESRKASISPYDVVNMQYTSGTTGFPKGVMLTDNNFNGIAMQFSACDTLFSKGQSLLNIMPPFIAYGFACGVHLPLTLGIKVVIVPNLDPNKLGSLIWKYKPEHMFGVPSHYQQLAVDPKLQNKDLSFIRNYAAGGDAIARGAEQTVNDFLAAHNVEFPIAKGYGMTEASSAATAAAGQNNKPGSVGLPLVNTLVSAFEPGTDTELPIGQRGELCISGPGVMKGYYNKPAETAAILRTHADGRVWVHTGDIGYLDEDGFVYLDSRIKRLIIRHDGFKVFPSMIENVVSQHPAVHQCSVVGCVDKDHVQGRLPFVYLVLDPAVPAAKRKQIIKELRQLCIEELPEYVQPVGYKIIPEMPLTLAAKFDYRKLEEEITPRDY